MEFSHKLVSKSSPWWQGKKTPLGRKTYKVLSILITRGNVQGTLYANNKRKRQWYRVLEKSDTYQETCRTSSSTKFIRSYISQYSGLPDSVHPSPLTPVRSRKKKKAVQNWFGTKLIWYKTRHCTLWYRIGKIFKAGLWNDGKTEWTQTRVTTWF